jgi:hypothetical protein
MLGAWKAEESRDVYLPTRLHLISGRCLPALAWSAKDRFLNGQSRVNEKSLITSRGSRSIRAKNAKVIPGWRSKGILRVVSPKCGGEWRPYPSPIMDEGNARFFRQFTQDLHSQSVVGLWHIWFRYSGNPIQRSLDSLRIESSLPSQAFRDFAPSLPLCTKRVICPK